MYANTLVGWEGSQRSLDALELALLLAAPAGVVTAMCSYWWEPLSARIGKAAPGEMAMRSGAEETLALLPHCPGRVLRTVPAPGSSPAQALLDLTADRGFDLIVVGSTHRGAVGRVVAGTTADALVHHGSVPVAVAPLGYRERAPRLGRVGVGYDGSRPARAALAAAAGLAKERDAELVVLAAPDRAPVLAGGHDAAQEDVDAAIAALATGVRVRGELLVGAPAEALIERAADLDLIVVGSKGHGVIGRAAFGSVSHALMVGSTTPVLVHPAE